jgi:hypothetical protein
MISFYSILKQQWNIELMKTIFFFCWEEVSFMFVTQRHIHHIKQAQAYIMPILRAGNFLLRKKIKIKA